MHRRLQDLASRGASTAGLQSQLWLQRRLSDPRPPRRERASDVSPDSQGEIARRHHSVRPVSPAKLWQRAPGCCAAGRHTSWEHGTPAAALVRVGAGPLSRQGPRTHWQWRVGARVGRMSRTLLKPCAVGRSLRRQGCGGGVRHIEPARTSARSQKPHPHASARLPTARRTLVIATRGICIQLDTEAEGPQVAGEHCRAPASLPSLLVSATCWTSAAHVMRNSERYGLGTERVQRLRCLIGSWALWTSGFLMCTVLTRRPSFRCTTWWGHGCIRTSLTATKRDWSVDVRFVDSESVACEERFCTSPLHRRIFERLCVAGVSQRAPRDEVVVQREDMSLV